MALLLHILLLLACLLLTAGSLLIYGKKPTFGSILIGFGMAAAIVILLICCTLVLSGEGNSSPLPLLLWGCVWLVAALIPDAKKAAGLCAALFLLFLILSWHHFHLATSNGYTDNPTARQQAIGRQNRSAAAEGKTRLPVVSISAHWWTPLTGLYSVEPASGGYYKL